MNEYNKLIKYNGFYKTKECREIVFKLSKGVCEGCKSPITLDKTYHVGHIIPQIDEAEFTQIYPSLDVDNLLNLHALCSDCNLKANRFQTYSIFMLNQMFNENYRKINQKLHKILKDCGHLELDKIQSFLEKNSNIDLFKNNGSILKNQDILDLITIIKNEHNINPIIVDKNIKYYKLKCNSIMLPFSICYKKDDNQLTIIDTKISSLSLSRIEKKVNDDNFMIIKNKKSLFNKLEKSILEISKEITKD